MYSKVRSSQEFHSLLSKGFRIVISDGKHLLRKGRDQWYIPAEIRDSVWDTIEAYMKKNAHNPSLIPNPVKEIPAIPLSISEIQNTDSNLPQLPSFPLQPEEYILHEPAARLLDSIAILEGLHKIDTHERHELPFAHSKGENKFSDKPSGQTLLSLPDITIRRLIDYYHTFQGLDTEISSLELENYAITNTKTGLQQAILAYQNKLLEITIIPRNDV